MSEYDDGYEYGREKGLDAVSRGGGYAFCFEHTYASIAETMTFDEGSDFYKGVYNGLKAVEEEYEKGMYSQEISTEKNDESTQDREFACGDNSNLHSENFNGYNYCSDSYEDESKSDKSNSYYSSDSSSIKSTLKNATDADKNDTSYSLPQIHCPRGTTCQGSTSYAITECYLDDIQDSLPYFLLQKKTVNMGFLGKIAFGGLVAYGEHLKEKAGHVELYKIYRCPKCKARVVYKNFVKDGVFETKMIGNDLPETSKHKIEHIKSQETPSTDGKIVKTLGVLALGALVIGALATNKDEEADKDK